MERCPFAITLQAWDEGYDICELTGKMCVLVSGDECDEYNEQKAEELEHAY